MTTHTPVATALHCELCIVGAGYAALNALNAAAKYLTPGTRVVVIDKREAWGGQWLDQYNFVRLHQPYRMFTAGDQPWTLERDPWHLATRREVLDHLGSVPSISAGRLDIQTLFGHIYTGHQIHNERVEVIAERFANRGEPVIIRAKRLLIATGVDIQLLPPLSLSSTRVRSVAVSDPILTSPEFLQSDAPVYIVGSGKTAMDCARYLIQQCISRRRQITVIAGSGMYFLTRDNICPRGSRRYYGGVLNAEVFLTMCELFDGQNEVEVAHHLERLGYFHTIWGFGGNFRAGMSSLPERDELRAGVDHVLRGYLVDVDGTRMTWREGRELREQSVPAGAYFINCTSHLRARPHLPVLQDGGLVCAPQFSLGLSGWSAYFITHLWFRDRLGEVAPALYRMRLDDDHKLRFGPEFAMMAIANSFMVNARLPPKIIFGFEGDVAKWYPAYRRVPLIAKVMLRRRALQKKIDRVLTLRFSDPPDQIETRPVVARGGTRASA